MAFYENRDKHQGKRAASMRGGWEDEGSAYTHHENHGPRSYGKPAGDRPYGKSGGERSFGKPYGKPTGDRPYGKPSGERSFGKPAGERFHSAPRPKFDRPVRSFKPMEREEAHLPSYSKYEYRPAVPAPVVPRPVVEEESREPENILCGRNPIREALKAGRDLEKLLVAKGELSGSAREIVFLAKEARVPVQEVERIRLDEIAKNHQGMIAFTSAFPYATVEEMLALAEEKGEAPFLILLDGVTDPHNLGAIIRTAECVGAHGVIVPERRSVGLTPAAVKASAGAVEYMKVARVANLNRTIDELKEKNIWVYGTAMDGTPVKNVRFEGGVALVVGAEGEGLSRLAREKCDQIISLPMKGHIDSLNASVAAGIVMYAVLDSRL